MAYRITKISTTVQVFQVVFFTDRRYIARYMLPSCMCLCLYVRPSHVSIVQKRLNRITHTTPYDSLGISFLTPKISAKGGAK